VDRNVLDPPAEVRPAEDLAALAAEINAEHEAVGAAVRDAARHTHRAGEKLLEAKELCVQRQQQWYRWLKKNCPDLPVSTANFYMRRARSDIAKLSDMPLPELVKGMATDAEGEGEAPHVAQNTGEQEWYTPPEYLDAARAVLGGFDLDPASSAAAQENVRAGAYYSREDDGLSRRWFGRVWMNPPYASGLVDDFAGKLVSEYKAGEVTAAVVLVNNGTETAWFRRLLDAASAVCFPTGRVRFLRPDGERGSPLQGQAVLYLGADPDAFDAAFGSLGKVVLPADDSNGRRGAPTPRSS
jgi:ParB family chromosome partitioning protein